MKHVLAVIAAMVALALVGVQPALAQDAAEKALWRKATTCDAVQAYLKAYPGGAFRAEATARRTSLCIAREGKGDGASADSSPANQPTATPRRPPSPPPPAPAEAATRGPGASSSPALPQNYEIVANVLLPGEAYLPGSTMPTGVVLLDRSQRPKNEMVCNAMFGRFTRTLRTEAEAKRDNPNGDRLVTHWLARTSVADEQDCAELMAKYDYAESERIRSVYGLRGSKGPIFLALDPTGEIIFLDLADALPQQVFKATGDWMDLALSAPQTGPDRGKPPTGMIAGVNSLFARVASGFVTLAGGAAPATRPFTDPTKGARVFNVYKAGAYLIGATFPLKG